MSIARLTSFLPDCELFLLFLSNAKLSKKTFSGLGWLLVGDNSAY
jgi:hypothetical protein